MEAFLLDGVLAHIVRGNAKRGPHFRHAEPTYAEALRQASRPPPAAPHFARHPRLRGRSALQALRASRLAQHSRVDRVAEQRGMDRAGLIDS